MSIEVPRALSGSNFLTTWLASIWILVTDSGVFCPKLGLSKQAEMNANQIRSIDNPRYWRPLLTHNPATNHHWALPRKIVSDAAGSRKTVSPLANTADF